MKCTFYGQYGVSKSPSNPNLKALCPKCHAIRTLQKRSGNMWFYPEHEALMGPGNGDTVEHLVFAGTGFIQGEVK